MALPTNIKTLLSGDVVEWARIELKESWDPASSLKTVCAFANDLTEGRNTGFKKILDALEANGSPKPEFETDKDRSYFITRLYVNGNFLQEKEPKRSQKGAEKEPKRSQKGAGRKQAILGLLEQNPAMTQIMLMNELHLSRKQIQSDIKELQQEGALIREGANRNGRWIVKK